MVLGNDTNPETPDPAEAAPVGIDGRALLAEVTKRMIDADRQFSRAIREAQATSSGLSQERIDACHQSLVNKSAIFKDMIIRFDGADVPPMVFRALVIQASRGRLLKRGPSLSRREQSFSLTGRDLRFVPFPPEKVDYYLWPSGQLTFKDDEGVEWSLAYPLTSEGFGALFELQFPGEDMRWRLIPDPLAAAPESEPQL